MGKVKLVKGKSGAFGLTADDGATTDVLAPEARFIQGKSGAWGVTTDEGKTVDVIDDFDESTIDSSILIGSIKKKDGAVGGSNGSVAGAGTSPLSAIDKLAKLAPDYYEQFQQAKYRTPDSDQQDFTKVTKTADGAATEPDVAGYAAAKKEFGVQDASQLPDLIASMKDAEAFVGKVVGRYENGKYVDADGKEITNWQPGNIVAVPKDKNMGGFTYPTGFAQLVGGQWKGVDAPNPAFVLGKEDELPGATVVGYGNVAPGEQITDAFGYSYNETDDANEAVKILRKPEVNEGDFLNGINKVITSDNDPLKEYLYNAGQLDGAKKLPWIIYKNPELAPTLRNIVSSGNYASSSDAGYKAMNDAVIETYKLNESTWDSDTPGTFVDAPQFFKMAAKADPAPLKELQGRADIIKKQLANTTGAVKRQELTTNLQGIMADAEKKVAELADVKAYFEKPEVQEILNRTAAQQKGFAILSQMQNLFPNRAANEEQVFQQQHKDLSGFEMAIAPVKALFGGVKTGVADIANFVQEKVGEVTSSSADNRAVQMANSVSKAQRTANNYVQHYEDGSGFLNLINETAEMAGAMLPQMALGAATGGGTIAGKVVTAIGFGASTAQSTIEEYRNQGIDEETANIAGFINGGLMAGITWGLGGKTPKGFKPSFAATEMLLNPELQAAGESMLKQELLMFRGGEFLKSFGSSTRSAAEMKVAEVIHTTMNGIVNNIKGTDLNTETGGVGDFFKTVLSFNIQHNVFSVLGKGAFTTDKKAAFLNAATENLKGSMDVIDSLMKEPGSNKEVLTAMQDILHAAAGLKLPEGLTQEQKTAIYLQHEQKRIITDIVQQTPEMGKYYEGKLKEIDKNITELLTDPEAAAAQVDGLIKPLTATLAVAIENPLSSEEKPRLKATGGDIEPVNLPNENNQEAAEVAAESADGIRSSTESGVSGEETPGTNEGILNGQSTTEQVESKPQTNDPQTETKTPPVEETTPVSTPDLPTQPETEGGAVANGEVAESAGVELNEPPKTIDDGQVNTPDTPTDIRLSETEGDATGRVSSDMATDKTGNTEDNAPVEGGTSSAPSAAGQITFQYTDGKVRRGTVTGTTDEGEIKIKGSDGTNYRIKEDQVLARDGKQVREAKTFDDSVPQPTEYKEKAKKFADKVRKTADAIGKDLSGGGLNSDISAPFRKLLQAGLYGAAEIIEAGGKLADAIAHVVDHIRTELGKTDEAIPSKRDLNKTVEDYFKANGLESPDTETTVKQDIKAATSTAMPKDAKANLKKQLRDMERGAKYGYKAGKAEGKAGEKARIEAIKTALETILKQAKDAGLFKGDLDGKLALKLAKEISRISTQQMTAKFGKKLSRILDDIDYDNKLTKAEGLQADIKKGTKSKSRDMSAATADALKDFAKIDPSQVADIDAYNDLAERLIPTAKGLKVRVSGGVATTKYENYEVSNAEVQAFTEKEQAAADQRAKDAFEETYQDLVDNGILDPATMSLDEMRSIVDAINGTDPDAALDAAEKLANNEAKMKALRDVVDYNKLAVDGYDETNLTDLQKKVLNAVQNIDTTKLTATELVKVNAAINEIAINDNFTGSGDIEIIHAKQEAIEEIKSTFAKLGITNFGTANEFEAAIASTHLLNEFITKNTKGASELQRASGTFGIFNGHAQAKDLQMKALDEYQKLKRKVGGSDASENHFRRGVLAAMANNFGGTAEEVTTEFNRMKGLIRQSADTLLKSADKDEVLLGKAYDRAYKELLDGSITYFDVLAKSDALNTHNSKLVDFWRNKFDERHAATREDAEIYNNKTFESVDNYTSTQVKSLKAKGAVKDAVDPFAEVFVGRNLTKQPAGTKESKTRSEKLTPQTFLDLDFDNVQNKRYYETNYDVANGRNIAYARLFFADPVTDALFGGQRNKLLVRDALANSVKAQIGTRGDTDFIGRAINKGLSVAVGKGVRIALGSIFQAPKQTISVWGRSAVNMGGDVDLLLKSTVKYHTDNKGANELMAPYSINIRGRATQGGTMKQFDLREDRPATLTTAVEIGDKVGRVSSALHDGIMYALTKSDEAVAKTTWLAFYTKSLRQQGLPTDISYSEMATNRNDVAAAYAEQMVSRTQVPNDPTAMGNFYKDKNPWKNLVKQYALPFSSFSTNQRVSMTNDMQKILFGTGKGEAVRSLAGTAVESALFNTLKIFLVGALVKGGSNAILSSFGYRDDEDEKYDDNLSERTIKVDGGKESITIDSKTKSVIAGAVSDYFFSGIGSGFQGLSSWGMNWMYNQALEESGKDKKRLSIKQQSPFFVASDNAKVGPLASIGLGTLAPAVDQVAQIVDNAQMFDGKTDFHKGKDKIVDTKVSTDEVHLHELSALVNLLALVGISDAEVTHANTQIKRVMDRKEDKRYGTEKGIEIETKGDKRYLKQ